MNKYRVGFEEEFGRRITKRTGEGTMNTYVAGDLLEHATRDSVELLTGLGYTACMNSKGMIEVDKQIDPEGLEAIRELFKKIRITSWDGEEDKGAAPLLIRELPLEELAETSK